MFEESLESVWRVTGRCLEGVWRVSGRCLEGIWLVSGSISKYCTDQSVSKYLKEYQSVSRFLKVSKSVLKVVKLRPCSASRNFFPMPIAVCNQRKHFIHS